MILALLYVTTNPDPDMAKYHFMGFTAARLGYSISYLCGFSFRGLFFIGGLAPMLSIGIQVYYIEMGSNRELSVFSCYYNKWSNLSHPVYHLQFFNMYNHN